MIRRLVAAAFLLGAGPLLGDVKMPAIFGDHMVLQQGVKLPIWGMADPSEEVTVTVADKAVKTTAGTDGKWRVDLPPFPEGTPAVTMTVTGKNNLKFEDVLIGDVWLCSGQSNMEFGMIRAYNAATEIPKATDPQIRLFVVGRKVALDPETDVVGKWMVCSPQTVSRFSAVGYFFGRELHSTLNRPIGLIGSYWGGTPAEAWTSLSALQQNPAFKGYVAEHDKAAAAYPKAKEDYPAKLAAYQTELKTWNEEIGVEYNKTLQEWTAEVAKATAAGQPPPPKPLPSRPPPPMLEAPEGFPKTASALFDGMIAPLIPYAIKGVIWYQGEANVGAALLYRTLFSAMITDWREKWGQGDFPFLFVQLAGFRGSGQDEIESAQTAVLRESQLKTLALPNTGMATAIDIGDPTNIHPTDKLDVGLRLALAAQHIAYGQNNVYSGPIYDKMEVAGNSVRVTFTQGGGGLVIGAAPWTSPGVTPLPNTSLMGFALAGADEKWFSANAKIDGNAVVISCPQVPQPVAVRYGWMNYPSCNLYNKEGLPASSFRSDDWANVSKPMAPSPPVPTAVP